MFATHAHVFQIDPETKKKWLPSSSSAVRVAYYHDPARKTYRIIAIENNKVLRLPGGCPERPKIELVPSGMSTREGVPLCTTQALVNSTITANMNFTKTSPKFGQWSDHRANTVYGLGFSSEKDLNQVGGSHSGCASDAILFPLFLSLWTSSWKQSRQPKVSLRRGRKQRKRQQMQIYHSFLLAWLSPPPLPPFPPLLSPPRPPWPAPYPPTTAQTHSQGRSQQ